MVEQGSLTINSLVLNFLVFSIFVSGSIQLYQAIAITIIISVTSTLVNAFSTWRILDHDNPEKVEIVCVEIILIGVVCLIAGVIFNYWVPVPNVSWLGLGGLFFVASTFYFLRDVLVYLKSISVLIVINVSTLLPLAVIFYIHINGEEAFGVWSFFQWVFLYPRLLVVFFLVFFITKVWDRFSISFNRIKFSSQPFLRAAASISVAVRVHAPYFLLNAFGLALFAELYRKFFLMLSPVSQVLQANYAFFLPRKDNMQMLAPSLFLSSVVGIVGAFVLKVFFWGEGGGLLLYAFITFVSLLMCFRAYYFVLNRIERGYSREIYLSSLMIIVGAIYVYNLESGMPDYYVAHIFIINEVVYLAVALLFNGTRGRVFLRSM